MIFKKLQEMIAAQRGIDKELIKMDSEIIKDLGADSLDIVELLMNVEEEFGITIDDDDVQGFTTVGDVVHYIEQLVK